MIIDKSDGASTLLPTEVNFLYGFHVTPPAQVVLNGGETIRFGFIVYDVGNNNDPKISVVIINTKKNIKPLGAYFADGVNITLPMSAVLSGSVLYNFPNDRTVTLPSSVVFKSGLNEFKGSNVTLGNFITCTFKNMGATVVTMSAPDPSITIPQTIMQPGTSKTFNFIIDSVTEDAITVKVAE